MSESLDSPAGEHSLSGKRLLIISQHFAPEITGIAKYNNEMTQWLAARGVQVRAVVPVPSYPEWRVFPGYCAWLYRKSHINNVVVYYCPAYVPRKPNAVGRMLHMLTFFMSSMPVLISLMFWRPHVVFQLEPPLLASPLSRLIRLFTGAKSWLHVQDFEFEAALRLGMLKGGGVRRILEFIQRWMRNGFNHVSSISPKMCLQLEENLGKPGNVLLFKNWVDTVSTFPLKRVSRYREKWGIAPDKVVVLYSGSMGNKQGLESVVEAARLLSGRQDLYFVLVGEGAVREELESMAIGLENLSFHNLVPEEALNELLNLADIHVLPQKAAAADLVLPSKLAYMLATARPVVAGVHTGSQIADLLIDCGRIVQPESPSAFADAIIELADDADLRLSLGANARKKSQEQFDKDTILGEFSAHLLRAIG